MKKLCVLLAAVSLNAQTLPSKPPAPKSEEWKNWIFAAVAAVTITAGVYILTLDNGNAPN
jgi:hypothetical protein